MLEREGVRVSVVCPGYVESPMTDALGPKVPRPYQVTMPVAVAAIVSGLADGEPVVAFPLQMVLVTQAVGALPALVRDWLARRAVLPPIYSFWRRSKREGAAAAGGRGPAEAAAGGGAGKGAKGGAQPQ